MAHAEVAFAWAISGYKNGTNKPTAGKTVSSQATMEPVKPLGTIQIVGSLR